MFRTSHVSSRRHLTLRTAARRATAVLIEPVERRTLMSAGALDPTFGTAGMVPVGGFAVAVDALGRTLVSGLYTDKTGFHGTLTRLLRNGSPDPSFGTDGVAAVDGTCTAILPLANGNILLSDGGTPYPLGNIQELTPAGQIDAAFGTGGTVPTNYGEFYALALGPNGTFYAADSYNHTVDRFTAKGQLDPTFGIAGVASLTPLFPVINGYNQLDGLTDSIAVDAAGRPIVEVEVYDASTESNDVALVRLTTIGKPDTSFGNDGTVVTSDGRAGGFVQPDPVIAGDGTIYVPVGIGTTGSALLAIAADGKTVTTGLVPDPTGRSVGIDNFALDTSGRLVIEGTRNDATAPGGASSAVVRFNPFPLAGTSTVALSFDATFAASGSVTLPVVSAESSGLALDPSGDIVVTGTVRILGSGPSSVTPVAASGKVIGSAGSYANQGNTVAKAFDGNLNTFYDAAHATGDWAGLDLGAAAKPIVQVQFAPRAGWAARMVGGQFQVSTTPDFSSDVQTIYTVTAAPPVGTLTTVAVGDVGAYRYARYLGPAGSYGNVAEVRFLVAGPTELTGTVIGTAGSYANQGNTIANAFDGNLNTFVDGAAANGTFVGLDLGTAIAVTQVRFAPRAGWANRMVGGTIQASNTADFSSGVVTAYTITAAPTVGSLTTVSLANVGAYRYWRYVGPAGSYGNIAELEFDA